MKNKGAIIFLSVTITILCLFSLSFTYMANKIDDEIAEYGEAQVAEQKANNAKVDFDSLRKVSMKVYRDSLWKKEVYLGYTFQEVKGWALNLGLDLQGGIHATLIVSPEEILKAMSDNSQDPDFQASMSEAKTQQRNAQEKFTSLFLKNFQAKKGAGKLAEIFVNVDNKFDINPNSTDEEIIKIIDKELDEAIDRSLIVLRARIDKFGTTSPVIQAVKSTGRIEIELPGADDEETITADLTKVAKLEFLEVWEAAEYYPYIQKINDVLVQKGETVESEEKTEAPADEEEANLFSDTETEATPDSTKTEDTLATASAEEELFEGGDTAAADSSNKE